jgi:hypothetical protein
MSFSCLGLSWGCGACQRQGVRIDSNAELGIYPVAKEAHNGQPKVNAHTRCAEKTVFSGQFGQAPLETGEIEGNLA